MSKVIPTPTALKGLFRDLGNEPPWRGLAAKCCQYRDNNPWTQEQKASFRAVEMPEDLFVNLIAAAMDSVTGYEAKSRTDWAVVSDMPESDKIVDALNHELNRTMRLAEANEACSMAYGSQVGPGVGWVYVGPSSNPLSPSILDVECIHRDEIFWDMRSRSPLLRSDCRYIVRRKFFDKDEAADMFPGQKELIETSIAKDWSNIDISDEDGSYHEWIEALSKWKEPVEMAMLESSDRPRIPIYQCWYKITEKKYIIFSDNDTQIFNQLNPLHTEMVALGLGQVQQRSVPVVREAWFIGPNCVYDGPYNAPHNDFPIVPFFGVRDDADNTPQGLIVRMIGPQDQYNRAALEIQHILSSVRIEMDEDATPGMDDRQVMHEVRRNEGLVKLQKNSRFNVIKEWDKLNALEGILARAKNEINEASGIFQTFQGKAEEGKSGIAVESMAELGAQTLGRINANYQLSRKLTGELAFSYVVAGIGTTRKLCRVPGKLGRKPGAIILNDGMKNRVSMFRGQVAMQPVHTSSGFKHYQHQRISAMMESLPDEFKLELLPAWIETADLPEKDRLMERVSRKLGVYEDEEEAVAADQAAAQQAEEDRQLERSKVEAENASKLAQAEKYRAEADETRANTRKIQAEIGEIDRLVSAAADEKAIAMQQLEGLAKLTRGAENGPPVV